ncbi:MAG: BamA/TamA family outer membrane protein, partial [Bacteroidota bacterium]|nr:BamA/TamA family outer membrane protein [Bacteroidota bacterium]
MGLRIALYKYFLFFTFLYFIAGCSNTKYLPDNDTLYTGAKVTVNGPRLKPKEKNQLRKDLTKITRPRPNSKILGLRVKLFAYNIAGKPKKEKSFLGQLKYKFGEPPALLSDLDLNKNIELLDNYMENRGYFQVAVTGDTIVKRKHARATYKVETGVQYKINDVVFEKDTTLLHTSVLAAADNTFLKSGDPYDLDKIIAERLRIDGYLKEHGFYYFNPDYIIVQADSTIGDNKVNLYVKVKPVTPPEAREVYRINDIYIFSNYSLNTVATDTAKSNAFYYEGYYVVDKKKAYKPKLFRQVMLFNPGDIYNRSNHNRSLNRLYNLGIFKFVKNRFEPVPWIDSAKLDVFYYLTPFPSKSLRFEINTNTKSNDLTGSQVSITLKNRNKLRSGELFNISAYVGSEIQHNGRFSGFNTFRTGAETTLSLPRFLVPFFNFNTRGGFVPKTFIQLGYDVLTKTKLYTLNSFRFNYGYNWKEKPNKEHELKPIAINYVLPLNVTQLYKDSIKGNSTLKRAIDTQFIVGSNYSYLYNGLLSQPLYKGGSYFNGTIDLSGNVLGLFLGGDAKAGKPGKLFNSVFSQYIRADVDMRQYIKTGLTSVLANRIIVGFGFPYGNSLELPFIKQFFVGGNNSIRAFRSRSVGPGSYLPPGFGSSNFLPDQSGDIKLELNTELRSKLSSIFNGAIFLDAGNIWLYNDSSYTHKPGSQFSKFFLKELAVGAGVGLRFDISFLVLRLDVAIPLRKPYLPEGQRWVINQINFGSRQWRRDEIV